jgi:hypothetical protein
MLTALRSLSLCAGRLGLTNTTLGAPFKIPSSAVLAMLPPSVTSLEVAGFLDLSSVQQIVPAEVIHAALEYFYQGPC